MEGDQRRAEPPRLFAISSRLRSLSATTWSGGDRNERLADHRVPLISESTSAFAFESPSTMRSIVPPVVVSLSGRTRPPVNERSEGFTRSPRAAGGGERVRIRANPAPNGAMEKAQNGPVDTAFYLSG